MWWLKLKCPFGGYGNWLFLILLCTGWILLMILEIFLNTLSAWIITVTVTILIVGILCYLINRPDKTALQKAQPLAWRCVSKEEKEHVRKNAEESVLYVLFMLGVWTIPCVMFGLFTGWLLPGFLFVFIPGSILILKEQLIKLFWFRIDDSAECAEIPVHHFYTVRFPSRAGGAVCSRYAVFYTPEGKFILSDEGFGANRIFLIRFRKRFRYIFMKIS